MFKIFRIFDRAVVGLGFIVSLCLIGLLGFNIPANIKEIIFYFVVLVSLVFISRELFRFVMIRDKKQYFHADWFDDLIVFLMMTGGAYGFISKSGEQLHDFLTWYWGVLVILGLFSALVDRIETKVTSSKIKLRPAQVFIFSFALPIVVGACLLKMPNSAQFNMSWVDAIFMATSAVAVTGLGVFDLHQLTLLGQVILLILVQLGGLGIMTLTMAFTSLIAGGLGVKDRLMLGEMLSEDKLSEVKSLLFKICLFTFVIEAIGIAALYASVRSLNEPMDLLTLWNSIFHGISAFCNAGFSLASENLMAPQYSANIAFMVIVMVLVVLGGLGFPTLSNLQRIFFSAFNRSPRYKILTTSSRMVLTATTALLVGGALLIWGMESRSKFSGMSSFESAFNSIFLSVTARTAGFNMVPTEEISIVTLFILIFLMWIGGAPMSTTGGIKVTTFFVGVLNLWSQINGSRRLEIFGKAIRQESVLKAYAVMMTSVGIIFLSSLMMVYLEPALNPMDILFEVVSAFSTVGLSRGVTQQIQDHSKLLLVMLMFVGRVGAITFLTAFVAPRDHERYKLLEDDVIIQ